MSSKVTGERKIEVEKDKVPKMTTHFESLAEKSNEEPLHGHVETTVPIKVTAAATEKEEQPRQQKTSIHEETQGRPAPSLEEISNLRNRAQQSSAEAIRAAEERYQKAKDSTQPESHQHQGDAGANLQDAEQAPKYYTTATLEKTQQAKDYAAQKAVEAKDALAAKGQSAAQLAAEKAKAAKETAADASKVAAEKAKAAKETAADASKVAAEYVGEKAAVAKDATVEGGKGAAGYVGKVASDVKDQAAVAGWGATHYTMEKVAEATKTIAGVTASAAGYTKDKVAGAGQTVAEKLAAAKDAVVASEEKAADFAARKKVEVQKDLEERKLAPHERVGGESFEEGEKGEVTSEKFEEYSKGGTEEENEEKPGQASSSTGTVFQAIGETIVEIGQTTKDLFVGQSSPAPVQDKDMIK